MSEALKYIKPTKITTLLNGIRVVTEHWCSAISAIGVFIGAGSRDEPLKHQEAHIFLSICILKEQPKDFEFRLNKKLRVLELKWMHILQESILYIICKYSIKIRISNDVLSDMLTNLLYNNHQIEVERDTILQELEETNKDFLETLMENVYFNIYRKHMMELPILGEITNINSITRDVIVEFHHNNNYGGNLVQFKIRKTSKMR